MNRAMFYDTKTTGLPQWKLPSSSESQPHIVQIAAKVVDLDFKYYQTIHQINVLVRPDGWGIPQEVVDIHGISDDFAAKCGISELSALNMLIDLWRSVDVRVAHNQSFDQRIVRIAIKRYFTDAIADEWSNALTECTQKMGHAFGKEHDINVLKFKSHPHLADMYKHFTGTEMIGEHDAMIDVDACINIYREMKHGARNLTL